MMPAGARRPIAAMNLLVLPYRVIAFSLLATLVSFASYAQDDRTSESSKKFAEFTFENDVFFNTDRYYTNGVQLTWGENGKTPNAASRAIEDWLCGFTK